MLDVRFLKTYLNQSLKEANRGAIILLKIRKLFSGLYTLNEIELEASKTLQRYTLSTNKLTRRSYLAVEVEHKYNLLLHARSGPLL